MTFMLCYAWFLHDGKCGEHKFPHVTLARADDNQFEVHKKGGKV